jgi:CheY-like chemotaxis protein
MNMPVMGGFEAAKLIREFNNIIIIAQTANGMEKIEKMP